MRRLLLKAGLLGVAVSIGLFLGEAAVRFLGFAPQISRINSEMKKTVFRVSENPFLGYVYKENYRDADADLYKSYPYINAHGFRDTERRYEKPPGVKRIILLGDSVAAGHVNIRSLDDTISRQLEELLEPAPVEVLNMGMTGYCTRGEVEMLKERGLRYDPDLVVLLFVHNDYFDMNMELGYVTPPRPVQLLFVHSHLFRYLGIKFNLFDLGTQFGVQEVAGEWIGWLLARDHDRLREIMKGEDASGSTLRGHLEAMGTVAAKGGSNVHLALPVLKDLSRTYGFKVAIGIWPAFLEEGIVDVESYLKMEFFSGSEELEIEKVAAANGIPTFRFSGMFREYYAEERREAVAAGRGDRLEPPAELFTSGDSMHPNPLGTRLAAQILKNLLERNPGLLGE